MRGPLPARSNTVRFGAPLGGINSVGDMEHLPDGDCIDSRNLAATDYGLRTRPGSKKYHTAVTMSSNTIVRSLLPFEAMAAANNKLFATTKAGIMDITGGGSSPGTTWSFPTATGTNAGYGVSLSLEVGGTKYLLYCDEQWGLYIYNGTSWARGTNGVALAWTPSTYYPVGIGVYNGTKTYVAATAGTSAVSGGPTNTINGEIDGADGLTWNYTGAASAWIPTHAYVLGDRVTSNGNQYVCVSAGTSGVSGPSGTSTGITDGTVVWDYVAATPTTWFGESLVSQIAGASLNPGKFVHVCVWKNRVWFIETASSRVWYGPINSLYGAYTHFDYGYRARVGGPLVALANWSFDNGNGLDTLLCGFTTGGDAIVYQGTDPDFADTFGLKGVWNVGPLLNGRKVVTDYGGELFVLSRLGVVSMAKLLQGADESATGVKLSRKVSNLFASYMDSAGSLGTALFVDPKENVLMATITDASGLSSYTMAMSLATGSWSRWTHVYTCYAVWAGELYMGDKTSTVFHSEGGLDAVLANGTGGTAIPWNVLSPFRGDFRHRLPGMVRPTILSTETNALVEAKAHYDFDTTLALPIATTASTVVGGSYVATSPVLGLSGSGRHVALEVGGSAKTRTVFVGADIIFEEGRL